MQITVRALFWVLIAFAGISAASLLWYQNQIERSTHFVVPHAFEDLLTAEENLSIPMEEVLFAAGVSETITSTTMRHLSFITIDPALNDHVAIQNLTTRIRQTFEDDGQPMPAGLPIVISIRSDQEAFVVLALHTEEQPNISPPILRPLDDYFAALTTKVMPLLKVEGISVFGADATHGSTADAYILEGPKGTADHIRTLVHAKGIPPQKGVLLFHFQLN